MTDKSLQRTLTDYYQKTHCKPDNTNRTNSKQLIQINIRDLMQAMLIKEF